MCEIRRWDIVGIGPDGILRPCTTEDVIIGIAACDSVGDEPVRVLIDELGYSTPTAKQFLTLGRDQFVISDEDDSVKIGRQY